MELYIHLTLIGTVILISNTFSVFWFATPKCKINCWFRISQHKSLVTRLEKQNFVSQPYPIDCFFNNKVKRATLLVHLEIGIKERPFHRVKLKVEVQPFDFSPSRPCTVSFTFWDLIPIFWSFNPPLTHWWLIQNWDHLK